MSQNLQALIQGMSNHEIEFLKTVCQHRSEAKQFLTLIPELRSAEFNHRSMHHKLGISMSHFSHVKTKLFAIALDSVSFYQHLVTKSRRPPSPQARCMRALRQAQVLRDRNLLTDANHHALKACNLARKYQLQLYQVLAEDFLVTTKRSSTKTCAISLYSSISTKTKTISQYYALQAACFELIERNPFTPTNMTDSKHIEQIIAQALRNINQLDGRSKAQLLLTQLWNLGSTPEREAIQDMIDELDKILLQLKDSTAKTDWYLLQIIKVAGETMHGRYENVEAISLALTSTTVIKSPLICAPLRRMTEQLLFHKHAEYLPTIVDSVLKNGGHLLLADEERYWRFLKGAVHFARGEYTKSRYALLHVTGYKPTLRLEVDLINLMSSFEQGDYVTADAVHDAFRKRVQRGKAKYHVRYRRIALLMKFLLRVAFKERTLEDLDAKLIDRNAVYKRSQLNFYEIDFDAWFWEKMRELGTLGKGDNFE